MSSLFETFRLRSLTLRNRIGVSPMCQYSSEDGFANDWHLVHLGSRAVGGAALVMVEATAVEPRGRITPLDMGLWKDEQIEGLARIARFVEKQGAVAGIQLAHAGRKGSKSEPWTGDRPLSDAEGGYGIVGPSAIPFDARSRMPRAMSLGEIHALPGLFAAAAGRARSAGFRFIELHAAHGYLLHSFHSPLSNRREDAYGGAFENRVRLTLETARALRAAWPEELPVAVRISCTDWAPGGFSPEESVALSKLLRREGIDLVDCSSGGLVPTQQIPVSPGYQVPFAAAIRKEAAIPTAAVGLIDDAQQAEQIVREGKADMVLLARAELRDPYFPRNSAIALGELERLPPPPQYERAFPRKR